MRNVNNPVLRFFHDEYATEEFARYSDGTIIGFAPSTPELAAGFERVKAALEARGYRLMKNQSRNSMSFSKPEFCKAAYIGTTVNPFSFHDPVWHWSNEFAISRKTICVSEVYKHNGTASNASLRISVTYSNASEPVWHERSWNDRTGINKYGVEIPKTVKYVNAGGCVSHGEVIRKFKPSVSDKVLSNILDTAENMINKIEIVDPSPWEADCNDFPKDNEKEWKAAKN